MNNLDFISFRILLPFILIICILMIFFVGIAGSLYPLLAAVFCLPLIIPILRRIDYLFIFIHVAGAASLTLPGIPQGLSLRDCLAFALVPVLIIRIFKDKLPVLSKFKGSRIFLLGFCIVIFVHIIIRGFGIKTLGGETWGGMNYLRILFAIAFLMVSDAISLKENKLKLFVILLFIGSSIPGMAQSLFILSKGAIYQQYIFVRSESWALLESLRAAESSIGIVRYHFMSGFAIALCMLALCFAKTSKSMLLILILALIPAALSGFRSAFINIILTSATFFILKNRNKRLQRAALAVVCLLFLYIVLLSAASVLPVTIQRSIAFLPMLRISDAAKLDAIGTIEWRMDIWRIMLVNIKEYFLVGRGLAVSSDLFLTIDPAYLISPEYAYFIHNYHSGPLGVLIDFGFAGLITVMMFLILSSRETVGELKSFSGHGLPSRFFCFLTAYYLTQAFMFVFIFGDMPFTFPNIIYHLSILVVLRNNYRTGENPEPTVLLEKA